MAGKSCANLGLGWASLVGVCELVPKWELRPGVLLIRTLPLLASLTISLRAAENSSWMMGFVFAWNIISFTDSYSSTKPARRQGSPTPKNEMPVWLVDGCMLLRLA